MARSEYGFDLTPVMRTTKSNKISRRPTTPSLQSMFETREKEAYEANKAREGEIRNTYADIISSYTNGAARESGMTAIEDERKRAVGQGTQGLISNGLFGTTTQQSLNTVAQKNATTSRLKLEDILTERTNTAKLGLANFIERIENPYPDYGMLLQAMVAKSSV